MVEEKICEIYPTDKIQSPVHLSLGQEHHIAALVLQLQKKDQVFTTYRSHAVYLAKGGNLNKLFAELYGKSGGISKGKAGSMHLSAPEVGLMGSSAIVASPFSHALGAAYALKLIKSNHISVSITGDGSTEEGVFHECLNFAALKQLPVLFVIENNGLAVNSPIALRQAFNLGKLVRAYDIKYLRENNGMNILSISQKSKKLLNEIRRNKIPAVFEIRTYRYREHVGINEDFDKGYRNKSEFEMWHRRDPLLLRKDLVKRFKDKIAKEIISAVSYAEKSPVPNCNDLLKDIK